eukprot:29154_5
MESAPFSTTARTLIQQAKIFQKRAEEDEAAVKYLQRSKHISRVETTTCKPQKLRSETRMPRLSSKSMQIMHLARPKYRESRQRAPQLHLPSESKDPARAKLSSLSSLFSP